MRGSKRYWRVYILRCGDGSLYTGIAKDVAARLAVHRSGKGAAYTRSHLPVDLVWTGPDESESEAKRREAAMKRWPKAKKEDFVDGKPEKTIR